MSVSPLPTTIGPGEADLQFVQKNRFWLLLFGALTLVLGLVAVTFAFIATLATMVFFGVLLLIDGVMHIAGGIAGRRCGGFLLHLLVGILYLVVGFLMIERPIELAAALTPL